MEAGQTIEQSEGEDCPVVHKLEKYCEALYQININAGTEADIRKSTDHLSELIASVIQDIDALPTKRVALFLPYKASMWDSLESIYLAARQDPECEAYVIPIPYFDKNPDGTIGQMHCEADEFPEDIPVTDWQTVDVEKTHPEMIFIHNPYDASNRVTTVHPDFYSNVLKNYTAMLVYVPYFVNGDYFPAHLAILPAIMNANKVIVKDDNEKSAYIKAIRAFEKENDCNGLFGEIEKKLLPLGSPKFDMVSKEELRRNEYEKQMPEDWKKKIYIADGNRRKVFFYNTSIQRLLIERERYLDKLERVFSVFQNKKENAVLLWRPHPLLQSTMKSMFPDLEERYTEIVGQYKKYNWGILDDSVDFERAIVISDAYFGDGGSSAETVYKVTGKPIMRQDYNI